MAEPEPKPTPIKADKTTEPEQPEQPQGITMQEAFDEACRLIGEKAVLDQLQMKRGLAKS